jgi:intracellular septation protein
VKTPFFLISFAPAIAYWYLEENYPLRVALTAGLVLAVIELVCERIFTGKLHTLSKFNFFLIAFLGGISLLGDEGVWFKLQPAFTGVGIACFLFYRLRQGRGVMLEMIEDMGKKNPHLPDQLFTRMEKQLAIFFGLYGLFMVAVALRASTDIWLFFKTLGFYLCFGVFLAFEWWDSRRQLKRLRSPIE